MTSSDVIVAGAGPADSTADGEPGRPGPSPAVFAVRRGESTFAHEVEDLATLTSAALRFAGLP